MASIYQFNSTENVWRITSIWRGYLYPRRKGIKNRIVNRNGGFHTITTKITRLNKQCSLITSNINGLNFPIKKKTNRLTKKWDWTFCCIQKIHLPIKDRHQLVLKREKKVFQASRSKKQGVVATSISGKVDNQKR